MKHLSKFAILILLIGMVFFVACTKEKVVTAVVVNSSLPPARPDTLAGKEFVFIDLIWNFDVDGGGNLYLGIENRPDLFGNKVVVGVYLKTDHDTSWVDTEIFHYPNSPGYVYSVYSNSLFVFHSPHIFPKSDYNHLAGTKVAVKVKFY